MLRVVRECSPRFVFAENVGRKPIERAAADLHRLNYRVRYAQISAAQLGAPHLRSRWWLVGDADSDSEPRLQEHEEAPRDAAALRVDWWQDDTPALGVPDGVSNRLDRLAALGNGQVPIVAAAAWRLLGASTGR